MTALRTSTDALQVSPGLPSGESPAAPADSTDSGAADSIADPLVFSIRDRMRPTIEILANFGIFAGRTVTSVEIDRLAQLLLDGVEAVTIVSEERHEIGKAAEASAHQVRIELDESVVPTSTDSRERLEKWVLERVGDWARTCIAERHMDA